MAPIMNTVSAVRLDLVVVVLFVYLMMVTKDGSSDANIGMAPLALTNLRGTAKMAPQNQSIVVWTKLKVVVLVVAVNKMIIFVLSGEHVVNASNGVVLPNMLKSSLG